MKRPTISLSALLGAVACAAMPAMAATPDLGVTVHVTQPGVYGRIDLGRVPPPVLVYPQPIVVQQPPRVVTAPPQPVYMWVPPGHQKHWSKHCGKYNACGVPVYFVQDGWYREHVMAGRGAVPPRPDGRPGYGGGPAVYAPNPGYVYADGPGRGDDRDRGHGQKWKDKDDDRGRGHGHKGKGKDD